MMRDCAVASACWSLGLPKTPAEVERTSLGSVVYKLEPLKPSEREEGDWR